jgi:hypothetical protein
MARVGRPHALRRLPDVVLTFAHAPSIAAAARELGIDYTTAHRWVRARKVPRPGSPWPAAVAAPGCSPRDESPGSDWTTAVRAAYVLDVIHAPLLALADTALQLARDPRLEVSVRLQAAARFQALVRQLGCVARPLEAAPAPAPRRPTTPRRDPRDTLQ